MSSRAKSFHSSRVVPVMTGTPAALPPRMAASTDVGRKWPSATGRNGNPAETPSSSSGSGLVKASTMT